MCIFAKPKSTKEVLRDHKRELGRGQRDLDKEIARLDQCVAAGRVAAVARGALTPRGGRAAALAGRRRSYSWR